MITGGSRVESEIMFKFYCIIILCDVITSEPTSALFSKSQKFFSAMRMLNGVCLDVLPPLLMSSTYSLLISCTLNVYVTPIILNIRVNCCTFDVSMNLYLVMSLI